MKRTILLILTLTLILGHPAYSKDEGLKKLQTWLKGLDKKYTLEELKSLTKLDLSYKKLKELPLEIGKLTNLKTLSLGSNQLTALPPEIGKLTNLQYLSLGDVISGVNQLTALPPEIGKLTNLTMLYLRNNPLSDKEKKKIKKLFPECEISFGE